MIDQERRRWVKEVYLLSNGFWSDEKLMHENFVSFLSLSLLVDLYLCSDVSFFFSFFFFFHLFHAAVQLQTSTPRADDISLFNESWLGRLIVIWVRARACRSAFQLLWRHIQRGLSQSQATNPPPPFFYQMCIIWLILHDNLASWCLQRKSIIIMQWNEMKLRAFPQKKKKTGKWLASSFLW